jgi:hypothetical protein
MYYFLDISEFWQDKICKINKKYFSIIMKIPIGSIDYL